MGHFPQNFLSPLTPKLLVQLKKSMGDKNGMDILYLHAKFGGDPLLHGGMRKKSWEVNFDADFSILQRKKCSFKSL